MRKILAAFLVLLSCECIFGFFKTEKPDPALKNESTKYVAERNRAVSALPEIENKTASLTVAEIQPVNSEIPSYKIIVINNSEKAVSAISFQIDVGGHKRYSGVPQGVDSLPLLKPGEKLERILPDFSADVQDEQGKILAGDSNQKLTISAVVFTDNSFEGDAIQAARFLAVKRGRKIQTERIIALLEQNAGADSTLGDFRKRAEKLGDIDDRQFEDFSNDFAALPDDENLLLRDVMNAAARGVKKEFIADLKNFTENRENAKISENRAWFNKNARKYQSLLSGF